MKSLLPLLEPPPQPSEILKRSWKIFAGEIIFGFRFNCKRIVAIDGIAGRLSPKDTLL